MVNAGEAAGRTLVYLNVKSAGNRAARAIKFAHVRSGEVKLSHHPDPLQRVTSQTVRRTLHKPCQKTQYPLAAVHSSHFLRAVLQHSAKSCNGRQHRAIKQLYFGAHCKQSVHRFSRATIAEEGLQNGPSVR